MEPRTLRRVSERLLALRASLRNADNLDPSTTGVTLTQDHVSGDSVPRLSPDWRSINQSHPDSFAALSCNVDSGTESRILDPSSPSLADRACSVGQAMKSRQFKTNPWSQVQPGCDRSVNKASSADNTIFFIGGVSSDKDRQVSGLAWTSAGSDRGAESNFEDQLFLTRKEGLKSRRRWAYVNFYLHKICDVF